MSLKRTGILSAILVIAAFALATAEISKLMSYQGRITNPDGTPVTDGAHSVRFDIYPVPLGGVSQWNETASITTVSGLFSHLLGSVIPISDFLFLNYDSLFLQVTYEGAVQSPRTPFTTVAYARRVHSIDRSNGGTISGYLNVWHTTGNYSYATLGTGIDDQAEMSLVGNERFIQFDLGMSGSSSVQLPQSAIGASEIDDESGVGSDNNTNITLTGTAQYLAGRTMNAPVDGYVLVIATAHAIIQHTTGTQSTVSLNVSDNMASFVPSTVARITLPASLPTGLYEFPLSSHALFPVVAGSQAYYALGSKAGATTVTVYDVQLSECFFPTAYTTVSDPAPPQSAAGIVTKPIDHNTERQEAKAFQRIRLETEVAQIKAELEAIREKVKRVTTDSASDGID